MWIIKNVYGGWITTQYLKQIKENSKLNNSGFNQWLEILLQQTTRNINNAKI